MGNAAVTRSAVHSWRVRLLELEGNTVTIHTGLTGVQSDAHILWFYRSEKADIKIVNSLEFEGKTKTDYNRDRFRDRLQLDRSSGSLTIRNISREDSGVYTLQIITGSLSAWSFRVKVYAPASKPSINIQPGKRSGGSSQSCSLQCSVENGEDVTLSWYEEKERISSISRSDSSEHLRLPLNRTFPNIYTYTCESANPVSHQTTQLTSTELCSINTDHSSVHCCKTVEFVVRLVLSAVVILATVAVLFYHFTSRTASNTGLARKSHQ
ncbi:CD48 antigen-like [Salminus brasiliensis]|uniref:CD48 antigen-like n=1 Tax=Salminus brasiliensis TaxID=930266 RepID=UPI003B8368DE